jgi:hypothetical protein
LPKKELSLYEFAVWTALRFRHPLNPYRIDGKMFLRSLQRSKNVNTRERYNILRIERAISNYLSKSS